MAREADNQLKLTNTTGENAANTSTALNSQLTPAYTSLMNTGYFSPEEKNAAVTNEMGAATAPFESAKFDANNRAAATNNPADLSAEDTQLALQEGQTAGRAAGTLQNQQMQNEEAGAYGLGQQANQQQQLEESMYGLGPGTLNAGTSAVNSTTGLIGSALGAGGTLGAAALKR